MARAKNILGSWLAMLVLGTGAVAGETNAPPDLSRGLTLYEIGYSHLDTQWRWAYPQVVREFLPNTVHDNVALLEKYPDYIFNWTGANRYRLIKEYHPADFALIKKWVAAGRWFPAGSSWEENDVNTPSPESEIRQVMFGHDFFKKEFGTESSEYMIPDCFGFPASLPSVLAHCGIRGFSTQKLTWGSAVGIPFNVGVWEGPDGNSVIAALNPGDYNSKVKGDPSTNTVWQARIEADGAQSGVYADYAYYGVGDRGGAPSESSVQWIEKSLHSTGAVHVISARADQMFNDITDAQKARLPKYQGDLLLTGHSAGSITSEAYMKRWNRENELLANAAETAAVAAHLLGAAPYPREKLHHAWELVLASQFHDMLPGTALPKAYEFCWNDEVLAMNSFAAVLQDSVGAVARGLDTRVAGTPLVVYNPLSIAREDVVAAELDTHAGWPGGTNVQVFDGAGQPVPTQVLPNERNEDAGKIRFLFLARVPATGFAVFSAGLPAEDSRASALRVSDRTLENAHYKVTLNEAGDIAQVWDKQAGRELLSAPARLAFLTENPKDWPAWNMDWADQTNAPRGYVDGPARIRIVENGPVRVAIEVQRAAENSIFTQTIRLAAGEAGDRVEVENQVDWQSKAAALKADFPLTVGNPQATYNWDLGKIQRGNNDPKKYEVPSHQWFDLTDTNGSYGVSVLCPNKYGSDKPADDELRLTLLYSPGIKNAKDYHEQQYQDWGHHEFVYGIYGHTGDWRAGKSDWQSARLSQPLMAFRTTSHDGKLGRAFSLLQMDSDTVAVRTIKLAEDNDRVVVRLQELNGHSEKAVGLTAANGIENITEVSGMEKALGPTAAVTPAATLDFTPYQMRSLELTLKAPLQLPSPFSVPVKLPYNLAAFSYDNEKVTNGCDGQGTTIPAEMIGDRVTSEGVDFQIGPRTQLAQNAVACQGQTIALPPGGLGARLYLLATAVGGDTAGTFKLEDQPVTLTIEDWSGYVGQWDRRVFQGQVKELTYSVTNQLLRINTGFIKRDPVAWFCSHRHQQDGRDQNFVYSYLFKYGMDVPAGAKQLTLPNNPHILLFAATLVANNNDGTQAVHPLYDDFSGREPVVLRPGWDGPAK